MSREIKFRAWSKSENKFRYPKLWDSTMPSNWDKHYELQQYTGLKDKDGKEIYEGDICKKPSSNGTKEQMCYGEIVFYKGSFCFKRQNSNLRISVDNIVYNYADCEIIGNIYENPELLP